jgi:hypothetical protein
MSIGEIAKAEKAAKENDRPKALERLSVTRRWAFDVTTKIGTTLVAAAIKSALAN